MKKFKVVIYLPENNLQSMLKALRETGVNTIGNYRNCMSWYPITGTWENLKDSKPYIGTPGEVTESPEYKLEFTCVDSALYRVLSVAHEAHLYEEPVIEVYALHEV